MSFGGMGGEIKIVVNIQNQEAIARLTRNIEEEKEIIRELNHQFDKAVISERQFFQMAESGARYIKQATAAIDRMKASMGGGGMGGMGGMGLLSISYAIDDLQYGFRAIVNNIPQVVLGLTGSAGIAGAAGIAAVAVNMLINHWGTLADALESSWGASTIAQLKDIRERAEAAAEGFKKLAEAPTKVAAAGAKELEEAIVEGPIGKVLEGIIEGVRKTPGLAPPEITPEMRRAAWAASEGAEKTMEESREKAIRDRAAGLMHEMRLPGAKGDPARKIVEAMALAHPHLFPLDFLETIGRADPEKRAEADRLEHQKGFDIQGRAKARAFDKKKEEEELKRKEEQVENEIKGRKNIRDFDRKMEAKAKQDAIHAATAATHRRHVMWQAADILRGAQSHPGDASGLDAKGIGSMLIKGVDANGIREKQLRALEELVRLAKDNPGMAKIIERMANMPARAWGPR